MITNFNDTKTSSESNFPEVKKYIGVGTVKVLAVNPSNSILKQYGWTVPDGADEPSYVSVDKDGKKNARVRFLVQIQELDEKPIVGIDFWIRPEFRTSNSSGELKVQVIDNFGRAAYVTKEEYDKRAIPLTSNGNPAKIDKKYRMAHSGEVDLVQFIMTFLNVTPFEVYDNAKKAWIPTKNPGEMTIDNWDKLCNGDVKEIRDYIALKPNNQMKVGFGVRTTQENKSYQAFLSSVFFANNIYLDPKTNLYGKVQREIDKYMQWHGNSSVTLQFDAAPVHEWTVSASNVTDNSTGDMPEDVFQGKISFDSKEYFEENKSDLPF